MRTTSSGFFLLNANVNNVKTKQDKEQVLFVFTHRAFFYNSVKHNNCFAALFPNHLPEVTTSVPQWALQKEKSICNYIRECTNKLVNAKEM